MAANVKLVLPGFRKLRTLPVFDDLTFEACEFAAEWLNRNLAPGFEAQRSPGVNRARAVVVAATAEAAVASAREPATVIAALNAARVWLKSRV